MADSESSENSGPRKGLWALMGQKQSEASSSSQPSSDLAAQQDVESSSAERLPPSVLASTELTSSDLASSELAPTQSRSDEAVNPGNRRKGLWSLMQKAEPVETPGTVGRDSATIPPGVSSEISASEISSAAVKPEMRSAFEAPVKGADRRLRQMELGNEVANLAASEPEPEIEIVESSVESPIEVIEPPPGKLKPTPVSAVAPIAADWTAPTRKLTADLAGPSRAAWNALIWGAVSLPISLIAIYPVVWTRIPALVFGFVALIFGFQGISEISRTRGRKSGLNWAYAGIVMGLFGMFAGPAIFTPLDVYGRGCNWISGGNLSQIGVATETYYQNQSAFPAGGIFLEGKPGQSDPLHGWMTQLLPYLPDGAGLATQLDLSKPYFDPVNQAVMQERIPSFMSADGDQALIQGQYGPAHFAGLGGSLELSDGSIAHAGVFDVNSEVTRDQISDGQSNTMIVGEIGHDYPAWGEPRNWRQIGKGLNREPQGFGNARHSGALFLMADGSVQYFANGTDPRVLQALSTRDGGTGF